MRKLYIANLPVKTTEEQVQELLAPFGNVTQLEVANEPRLVQRSALVELESELDMPELLNQLGQLEVGDRRILVTPARPGDTGQQITPEQSALAKEIADYLGETVDGPRKRIARIVKLCDVTFAQSVFEQTKEIEATGGMMTVDGTQRRTPGGTFFYLTRRQISTLMRNTLFPLYSKSKSKKSKQRAKQVENAPKKPRPAPAEQPASEPVETAPKPSPEPDNTADQAAIAKLRQELQSAQQELDAIRAGKAQGSLMATMKRVMDLQQQVDAAS